MLTEDTQFHTVFLYTQIPLYAVLNMLQIELYLRWDMQEKNTSRISIYLLCLESSESMKLKEAFQLTACQNNDMKLLLMPFYIVLSKLPISRDQF